MHTDPTTGLGISLPEGWRTLSGTPAALAVIDQGARDAGAMFVPNIVGTVSKRQPNPDLDSIVRDATLAWLDAVPYSHVVGLLSWAPENHQYDSRLVYGSYSNGLLSLTLITAVILAEGIVSRLDLTVDASISRSATELMFDVLDDLRVPTMDAGRNVSGADLIDYRESILAKALPR